MLIEIPNSSFCIREADPDDESAILKLLEACDDYFHAVTGMPAGPGDVQSLFYSLPEGADWENKRILVVADPVGEIVGVIDAVLHSPDQNSCAIGLFLLHPNNRRQGTGSSIAHTLRGFAAEAGISRITATVPVGWESGGAFLRALSFKLIAREIDRSTVGNRQSGPQERPVLLAELTNLLMLSNLKRSAQTVRKLD